MPLYLVEVTANVLVDAKNEDAAIGQALYEAEEDILKEENCIATKVTSENEIPKIWRNCIPWGNKKDQTCEEILRQNK